MVGKQSTDDPLRINKVTTFAEKKLIHKEKLLSPAPVKNINPKIIELSIGFLPKKRSWVLRENTQLHFTQGHFSEFSQFFFPTLI